MILCALAGVQIVWFVSLQWPVFVTPMPQVMSKNLSPPAVQTQEPSPRSKTSSVIRPIPRAMCSWPAGGAIAAGEDATDGRRSAGEEEEECDGSVAKKAALILSVAGSPRRLGRRFMSPRRLGRCFMSDFDIVGDTFILLLSSKDIFREIKKILDHKIYPLATRRVRLFLKCF
jgi:hypothetical protein